MCIWIMCMRRKTLGGEVFLERNTSPPKPTSPKNFPNAPVPTRTGALGKPFFRVGKELYCVINYPTNAKKSKPVGTGISNARRVLSPTPTHKKNFPRLLFLDGTGALEKPFFRVGKELYGVINDRTNAKNPQSCRDRRIKCTKRFLPHTYP